MKSNQQNSGPTQSHNTFEFQTMIVQQKDLSVFVKEKKIKKSSKISRWTQEQNILYLRFLKQNLDKLNRNSVKKFLKFQKMSIEIETKSADQCRSHHQKMIIKFKSIENIIAGVIPQNESEIEIPIKIKLDSGAQMEARKVNSQILIQKVQNCSTSTKNENQKSVFESLDSSLEWNLFDVLFEPEIL